MADRMIPVSLILLNRVQEALDEATVSHLVDPSDQAEICEMVNEAGEELRAVVRKALNPSVAQEPS